MFIRWYDEAENNAKKSNVHVLSGEKKSSKIVSYINKVIRSTELLKGFFFQGRYFYKVYDSAQMVISSVFINSYSKKKQRRLNIKIDSAASSWDQKKLTYFL